MPSGAPQGRLRAGGDQHLGLVPVLDWVEDVPADSWHRLSAGAKGPRLYDFLPFRGGVPEGWGKGLLIRRSLSEKHELAFYLTSAPPGTTLADLVRVAGTRWTIEECFEAAKGEVGLDQYELDRLAPTHHLGDARSGLSDRLAQGGHRGERTWSIWPPICCP
jgi:hypothetical protein